MVERNGRFGRKNGKGFYDYPASGKKTLWPGLAELADNKLDPDTLDVTELKQRFLVMQAVEAARTMAEHVVTDPREADVGSILGFGFAPFTGGALVLYRRHGRKGLRRAVRRAGRQAWRALRAAALAARNGGERRDVLSPLQGGVKRAYWSAPCRQQPTR